MIAGNHVKVALFRGRGAVSRFIRWQTRSPHSHAALVLPDNRIVEAWQGRLTLTGFQDSGVRKKTLEDWTDVEVYEAPALSDMQSSLIHAWAEKLARQEPKYDYRGVLRFISRRNHSGDRKWFCSELVHEAFNQAHFPLLFNIPAWKVYPGMLAYSPRLNYLCSNRKPEIKNYETNQ